MCHDKEGAKQNMNLSVYGSEKIMLLFLSIIPSM